MDQQQTYLLNGLLARQFGLGRIVRFREVRRGRQAATYEVMTAQQHEYVVYLYPAAYRVSQLSFMAGVLAGLDRERFTVVPMVAGKDGSFVGEGPQGTRMMVSLGTEGSVVPREQLTSHDISQVGLRLAWMHRLLKEHVDLPLEEPVLGKLVAEVLEDADGERVPDLDTGAREALLSALSLPAPGGLAWAHGDVEAEALLHDADRQLRTVVDWGLLHAGSPLEDVVDALWMLCGDGAGGLERDKAAALLEAYDSLSPVRKAAWTGPVAMWAGRRFLDAAAGLRPAPAGLARVAGAPEKIGVLIASCTW
jgi:Ser/Thr protein kinase RdoA (MazF antagonist)